MESSRTLDKIFLLALAVTLAASLIVYAEDWDEDGDFAPPGIYYDEWVEDCSETCMNDYGTNGTWMDSCTEGWISAGYSLIDSRECCCIDESNSSWSVPPLDDEGGQEAAEGEPLEGEEAVEADTPVEPEGGWEEPHPEEHVVPVDEPPQ